MSVMANATTGDATHLMPDTQAVIPTTSTTSMATAKTNRTSRLFSAPPSISAGAIASLARAPLMRMDAEVNASSSSLPNRQSTSDTNTPQGESSSTIIGPNGALIPRSSILLNPSGKQTFIEQWRPRGEDDAIRPAPAVLKIPAAPTARDREKQRERERIEREREIEREVREKEQAEKVWGIPKKAFYLGMGEVNFNAQMAMLGGWGNGSADIGPLQAPLRRKSLPNRNKQKKPRPGSKAGSVSEAANSKQKKRPNSVSGPPAPPAAPAAKADDGADSDASSIDLEELAALNAIINTRRSMEAAQALAGGMVSRPVPPLVRTVPPLDKEANNGVLIASDTNTGQGDADSEENFSSALLVDSEPRKIKFAPLPTTYNVNVPLVSTLQGGEDADVHELPISSSYDEAEKVFLEEDDDSESDEEIFDGDESYARRWTSGKGGKWYLMGMPKSVFSTQYYRSLQRRPGGPDAALAGAELSSSPTLERKPPSASTEVAASERRGRRTRRAPSSRASSVKSRSSSVGSIEDDERERRRQLLRASRPGGTGMLTLPDGTKIRARRVGERYSDNEEDEERVAGRSSIGGMDVEDVQLGDKRASDDEGGRESDTQQADGTAALVKRRRRSMERLQAEQVTPTAEQAESLVDDVDGHHTTNENEPLRRLPKRSMTLPAGPVPLSATQAAEVRRRHEEEVGALAAEVLQNIAKAKKAKQQQELEQQQQSHQKDAKYGQSMGGKTSSHHNQGGKHDKGHAAQLLSSGDTATYSDRGRLKDRVKRSFTTDDSRHRKSGMETLQRSGSREDNALRTDRVSAMTPAASNDRPSTPTRKLSTLYTGGPTITHVSSPKNGEMIGSPTELTDSVTSIRTLRPGSHTPVRTGSSIRARARSPDDGHRTPIGHDVAALNEVATTLSTVADQSALDGENGELPSLSAGQKATRSRLPGLPSPLDLPRRPDVRGYAVVPLPIKQLGRRPLKPREGNFWGDDAQIDTIDVDGDPSDDEVDLPISSSATNQTGGESDDDDSDMDADQLAEEERRTAVQKKRATTRAAGAEIVSGLGPKHKAASAAAPKSARMDSRRSTMADQLRVAPRSRSSSSLARSFAGSEGRISSEYTDGIRIAPKTSRSSQLSNGTIGASSLRTSEGGSRGRAPLSTAVLSTARDRKGNSVVRLHRKRDTWNDFDSDDDEPAVPDEDARSLAVTEEALDMSDGDDLWPPTLDNALGGLSPGSMLDTKTPPISARPGAIHRLSSSSSIMSGASLSSSKYDTTSAARLAAHSAKSKLIREKRERETKERERQKALDKQTAEDSIEYGWPKSLQGSSLY